MPQAADAERPNRLRAFMRALDLERCSMTDIDWALTHRSYLYELAGPGLANPQQLEAGQAGPRLDNERLEFLGDAVIGAVAAEALFERFPEYTEGQLTKRRAQLVSRAMLGQRAQQLGFGEVMLLGIGERATGGGTRVSILGSALEALVGVIYLRMGYGGAREFILRHILEALLTGNPLSAGDYKSMLQEWSQGKFHQVPQYRQVAIEGPDHARRFTVAVEVNSEPLGEGIGTSLKAAQSAAARSALEKLGLI